MKKFCKSLREHAMKIINFEKKKMIPLTNEEYESYFNQTSYHICNRKFLIKIIEKLKTIVIILLDTEVFHIAHVI